MTAPLRLPMLAERSAELSTCAFCPKLCRATCLVSDAQPTEAVTPWGKMSSAFDVGRGGALDAERAALAWACSGCFRCREACDHSNPVAETLSDARADYVARGHAPASVLELLERREAIEAASVAAVERLRAAPCVRDDAPTALVLGCRYARELPEVARDAIRVAVALAGPLRLVSGCCGAWQDAAGARPAAEAARAGLAREVKGARRLLVLDARCALSLREAHAAETLVELAARHLGRFRAPARLTEGLRYHDSCAFGRGLGLYEEPRRLLRAVSGRAPAEFEASRELSRCSGAGGLLPISMPDVARAAAARRIDEHLELGGGTIVTTCASSLSWLRRQGAATEDLFTLLARGLDGQG